MSINRWMDKEAVVHIYNGILLSHKKEHIWVSSNEVDEPRAYYTEWVSQREKYKYHISSVQFSNSVMSDSLRPHGMQPTRPPCPSPAPRTYSNSCPLSWWCHPTISSSVVPFSSRLQSFPASGSFQMSHLFTSGGQSIGVSASTSVLRWYTDTYIWNLETWCFLDFHMNLFVGQKWRQTLRTDYGHRWGVWKE